jgi:NADPH:quinone reductase-like Zn-dependent oxidoreductase
MQAAKQMNAIVRRKYGTPDVLAYEMIERPIPGDEDVLVQVHAAGASIGEACSLVGFPKYSGMNLGPRIGCRSNDHEV